MLTRDFKTTIMARARRDQDFRAGMLEQCVELVLNGEPEVGQQILGDLIEATIGLENRDRSDSIGQG